MICSISARRALHIANLHNLREPHQTDSMRITLIFRITLIMYNCPEGSQSSPKVSVERLADCEN